MKKKNKLSKTAIWIIITSIILFLGIVIVLVIHNNSYETGEFTVYLDGDYRCEDFLENPDVALEGVNGAFNDDEIAEYNFVKEQEDFEITKMKYDGDCKITYEYGGLW